MEPKIEFDIACLSAIVHLEAANTFLTNNSAEASNVAYSIFLLSMNRAKDALMNIPEYKDVYDSAYLETLNSIALTEGIVELEWLKKLKNVPLSESISQKEV